MAKTTDRPGKDKGGFVPPRYQQGPITMGLNLGPLASLAGSWKGTGFNVMWRPDNPESQPCTQTKRFLELNLTSETLDFQVIPGVVPNRGLNPQTDLSLYGLHYLQRVSDADLPPFSTAGQALHIEPGLFMNVPAASQEPSTNPASQATIVRMGSIPHGVTLLMQGPNPGTTPNPGPPLIPPIYPNWLVNAGLPVFAPPPGALGLGIQPVDLPPPAGDGAEHIVPEVDLASDVSGSQSNGPFLPNIPQAYADDPNTVLRNAIAGQDILGTITITLSTGAGTGLANIPFLGIPNPAQASDPNAPQPPTRVGNNPCNPNPTSGFANAFVYSSAATFWIEWVRVPYEAACPGQPPKPPRGGPWEPHRLTGTERTIFDIEPFWPEETFLQLQYSQVSILVFNCVLWPHVNVATLTLSGG
jgi:hypothetical protein